ncbi:hypothetical protein J056_000007 [Wallemia ichthyophaga EXF-994]|uniref:Glutamate pyruvate transaminase n=1 Tax=Wallemia ichthyophaga (strain EXF-994 / CBS 113033) TaxID=1299270 RepID=R9AX36_WALI9|nr:uncharacterized protein J056_000007 [Wallemia ichthyophaga EXF-994]EOR04676.1 hypothetical protein J056_000007 [Wallemia ichthyophaga EXF-994]
MSSRIRSIRLDNSSINPKVLHAQYAVRGEIPVKADKYGQQIRDGHGDELPFNAILPCNIGNPQQQGLNQKPLTFWRQVAALTECPELINNAQLFPKDARDRASQLLHEIGSVGAYSHSKGVPFIRKQVADFLESRDGYSADPENIFLTAGASGGVNLLFHLLLCGEPDGVMIPIPQYPLYSASLALAGSRTVQYHLDENKGWELNIDLLEKSLSDAKSNGTETKALVIINPGNPTGAILSEENIIEIAKFAHKHELVLIADEVYQSNIYDESKPFISFKKVARDLKLDTLQLASFHSVSKGFSGECGKRGGFVEFVNFSEDLLSQATKLASISLCPPLQGQVAVDLLIRPPKEGDESYDQFSKEKDEILTNYASRSKIMADRFNKMDGVTCNNAEGAMYAFPQIRLPQKAQDAAKKEGKSPDAFYCMELLNNTGICVVPGGGFGQSPGTLHFRTTCLVPGTEDYINTIEKFHQEFMDRYRD